MFFIIKTKTRQKSNIRQTGEERIIIDKDQTRQNKLKTVLLLLMEQLLLKGKNIKDYVNDTTI